MSLSVIFSTFRICFDEKAITELGDDLPQAFFVANDTLAIAPFQPSRANISVPDRVSLISFNDTALTKQVFPALSSITVYTEEMGRTAVDILNHQLIKRHHRPNHDKTSNHINPSRAQNKKVRIIFDFLFSPISRKKASHGWSFWLSKVC